MAFPYLEKALQTKNLYTKRSAYQCFSYVYAQQGLKTSTFAQIELAFRHLEKSTYDENLNLLFYIAALSYFHISKFDLAIQTLEKGIKFALSNNSHSMMINSLYLMANIAEMVKEENVGLTIKSYSLFNSFIHQPLYEEANWWNRFQKISLLMI